LHFGLDVTNLRCADFGCSTGGFTDCLLQRGARQVIAIDTGYGILDWTLRNDVRVEVRERSNVLHADPPQSGVDLIVIDVGWTPQARVLSVADGWLAMDGRVITLIKPHYERSADPAHRHDAKGLLSDEEADSILAGTLEAMPALGWHVLDQVVSPIRGAKSGKGRRGEGNLEFLALLKREHSDNESD
jgi:23S rRNA (cytidine1920-2'-O)/16S rRNA (cytidine1409-2'-O)-methyltransferase